MDGEVGAPNSSDTSLLLQLTIQPTRQLMTIICMHCKRKLDAAANGQKRPVEEDREHTREGISHGLCPDCLEKHYPADKR